MTRNAITEGPGLAAPLGPFSRACWAGDLLYVSGQTGVVPETGALPPGGDVAAETRQVLKNLAAVLSAAGLSFADVIKANVFLADMADFRAMNAIYAEAFDEPRPARTTIGAAALPGGARVEIELVAMKQRG